MLVVIKNYADKKKVYVIKANGIIRAGKQKEYLQKILRLEPGDTIVVPRKISKQFWLLNAILPVTRFYLI